MLSKAGRHVRLWIKRYRVKLLKPSLSMLGFHEKACAAAEKGRWSELYLMVRKTCAIRGKGKHLLKRHRAPRARVHIGLRCQHVTHHAGDQSVLARNSRGWEEDGIVEVWFSLWRSWLACASALDLDALDTVTKKVFATKEELMVVATLVRPCRIQDAAVERC
jgi:hypothetical protein